MNTEQTNYNNNTIIRLLMIIEIMVIMIMIIITIWITLTDNDNDSGNGNAIMNNITMIISLLQFDTQCLEINSVSSNIPHKLRNP